MKDKLMQLTAEEEMLILLALETTISTLYNRFKEEPQYVHPAKQFERLYDKLKDE